MAWGSTAPLLTSQEARCIRSGLFLWLNARIPLPTALSEAAQKARPAASA